MHIDSGVNSLLMYMQYLCGTRGAISLCINPETSLLVTDFTSCIMQKIFIYHEKIVPQVQNFGTGGKLALAELQI